jgi:hypothetical protein
MELYLLIHMLCIDITLPESRTTEQAIMELEAALPGLDLRDGVVVLKRGKKWTSKKQKK